MIRTYVDCYKEKTGVNAILHLDHCRKMETIERAIDEEWDSVMLDASNLSLDENIAFTNQATKYVHDNNRLIEAEVGQIRGPEENIHIETDAVAEIRDIKTFLSETDVD